MDAFSHISLHVLACTRNALNCSRQVVERIRDIPRVISQYQWDAGDRVRHVVALAGLVYIVNPLMKPLTKSVAECAALSILKVTAHVSAVSSAHIAAVKIAVPTLVMPILANGALIVAAVVVSVVLVRCLVIPLCQKWRRSVAPSGDPRRAPQPYGQVRVPRFTTSCAVDEHSIRLDVAAADMEHNPGRCLKVLADALLRFNIISEIQFSCVYLNQKGSDNGGLRREVLNDILAKILKVLQADPDNPLKFSLHESDGPDFGYYSLTDSGDPLPNAQLELCQNIGVLIGALCAGFVSTDDCKLANLLSPKFYRGLIYLAVKRNTLSEELGRSAAAEALNLLHDDVKREFCAVLAMKSSDDPLYELPLLTLVNLKTWDLNAWSDDQLKKLLAYFQGIGEGPAASLTTVTELKAVLQNAKQREEIAELMQKDRMEYYGQYLAPLRAIEEGFSKVPGAFNGMCERARELSNGGRVSFSPNKLAQFIQGLPFTYANFVSKLPARSILEAKQVRWVYEWLGTSREGICSRLYKWMWRIESPLPATDKERQLFMKYVTGVEGLSKKISSIHVSNYVDGFTAHTCGASLDLPNMQQRELFIDILRSTVHSKAGAANFNMS